MLKRVFMIEKLKDFWSIFKNSKHEFYKEKYEALELLERVKHIKCIISTSFKKNKAILDYLYINVDVYPKYMFNCINDLISLFKYGVDYETFNKYKAISNVPSNLIYVFENIDIECNLAYNYMNESFKKKYFANVKEKYVELIKKLRDYEERYDMVILDYFYDYDKI